MTMQTLTRTDASAWMVGYPALDTVKVYDNTARRFQPLNTFFAGGPPNAALAASTLALELGLEEPVRLLTPFGSANPPDLTEFDHVLCELLELQGMLRENITYLGGDSDDEPRHGESTLRVTDSEIGWFEDRLSLVQSGQPVAFTGSFAPGETPLHRARMIWQAKAQGGIPVIDTRPENILAMLQIDPTLFDGAIIKQNEAEFTRLVHPGHLNGPASWARHAWDLLGSSTFVITRPDCTFVVTPHEANRIHLPSEYWPRVVSRVGCGDCTVAGITIGLRLGMDIVQAVCLGKGTSQANVETHRPGGVNAKRALYLASHMEVDPVSTR